MASARLTLALEAGAVGLPGTGRIAVFAPRMGADLSALPRDRTRLITRFKPDHDHFAGQGWDCALEPNGRFSASVVVVPRAKPLARALVAEAAAITDGAVILDGAKTDGVESLLKDLRRQVAVGPAFSKAHGKVFAFEAAGSDLSGWAARDSEIADGFVTRPGVFSADGIDPASALLAAHLPARLGRSLADLGAGWGYLSAQALNAEGLETLHLVEADHTALECARRNVMDPRVQLHWADATVWKPTAALDGVIMNPPFHTGRAADPDLGRGFIRTAARILLPSGRLWMVANRHLPYEAVLSESFRQVTELAGDNRFKVLSAERPSVARR